MINWGGVWLVLGLLGFIFAFKIRFGDSDAEDLDRFEDDITDLIEDDLYGSRDDWAGK